MKSSTTDQLLKFFDTERVSGAKKFVAKEKFREGEEIDGVRIYHIDNLFKWYFLGKEEKDVKDSELKIYSRSSLNYSPDMPIIDELGGKKVCETRLAYLWSLLEQQGDEKIGPLITNTQRLMNTFYIPDFKGVARAVDVYRNIGCRGWSFKAYPIGYLGIRSKQIVQARVFIPRFRLD